MPARVPSSATAAAAEPANWRGHFLSVTVDGFVEASGHTEYEIVSRLAGQRYPSQHRYTDFRQLHDAIQGPLGLGDFPVAKQSRIFSSEKVNRERVPTLQAYLRGAVESAQARGGVPDALSRFLQLPQEFAMAHEETRKEWERQERERQERN